MRPPQTPVALDDVPPTPAFCARTARETLAPRACGFGYNLALVHMSAGIATQASSGVVNNLPHYLLCNGRGVEQQRPIKPSVY